MIYRSCGIGKEARGSSRVPLATWTNSLNHRPGVINLISPRAAANRSICKKQSTHWRATTSSSKLHSTTLHSKAHTHTPLKKVNRTEPRTTGQNKAKRHHRPGPKWPATISISITKLQTSQDVTGYYIQIVILSIKLLNSDIGSGKVNKFWEKIIL